MQAGGDGQDQTMIGKITEISTAAALNAHPPGLTDAEELLWYKLRDIYRDYQSNTTPRDLGAAQKAVAVKAYNRAVDEQNRTNEMYKQRAEYWKNVELAANQYHAERTLEAADRFVGVVYGLLKG